MNRIINFGRIVKENYYPEQDPNLIEATENSINMLAKRSKISDEVLQKIEENKGKGDEYLRKNGRIQLSAISKARLTMYSDIDSKMSIMETKSLKPRSEIPHIKTKFEDMTIDEIIEKIDKK
jgi:hypothetical protein